MLDMDSQSNVTTIIVNWNTGKLLKECLQSLAQLPEKDLIAEVIVVDNASSDDSFNQVKSVDIGRPTMLMSLPKNIGFAAANNIGLRRRRDKESHVLLLNPDTVVQAGVIRAALTELSEQPKTGVVGVKLLEEDGDIQRSVRTFPNGAVLAFLFLKLNRLRPRSPMWQRYLQTDFDYTKRQVVDQVMGAFFFIRNAALEKVGWLDEGFWVWFEEVDYCQRAMEAGWEITYIPNGSVMHYGGVSFHQLVGLRKTLPFLDSALRYARKHLSFVSYLGLLGLWPVAVLLALPASLFHVVKRYKNRERL